VSLVVACVVALLCLMGVPWSIVAILAAIWIDPRLGLVAAVIWAARRSVVDRRTHSPTPPAPALLRELASSIEAGATLRTAIADAPPAFVDDTTRRLCLTGAPIEQVAASLGVHVPEVADALPVIARISESSGGSVAGAIRAMASVADDAQRRRREIRVATAQSRFSAVVVGVVPVLLAIVLVSVRGVPEPGGPAVVIPMILGAVSMLVGSAVVFVMASRAAP
jgi:Flp pilus assembly protein TadB